MWLGRSGGRLGGWVGVVRGECGAGGGRRVRRCARDLFRRRVCASVEMRSLNPVLRWHTNLGVPSDD